MRVDRSAYDVLAEDGPTRLPALPACEVTVGDWLAVTDDGGWALLPRTSLLVRGSASGVSRSQPLAANVDVVLVVASLSVPLPVRRIERLLTLAWESGATPVVVLTTTDDKVEIQRCYDLGCNVYITKPVNYESFADAIRQLGLFLAVIQVPEVDAQ